MSQKRQSSRNSSKTQRLVKSFVSPLTVEKIEEISVDSSLNGIVKDYVVQNDQESQEDLIFDTVFLSLKTKSPRDKVKVKKSEGKSA